MSQFDRALRGPLDERALEEAWRRVVARHAVLRTFFVLDHGDKPLQIVRKSVDLPFDSQDWTDTAPEDRAARFFAFLRRDRVTDSTSRAHRSFASRSSGWRRMPGRWSGAFTTR